MQYSSKISSSFREFLQHLTTYICTFKEEDNIGPCIDTVRSNGCHNIVVIDSSPDDITAKKARLAGADVIKAAKGLASQRQRAVEHCRSDYLFFVDADDRLDSGCLAALWRDMELGGFAAVQASLGVWHPQTYWEKAADALWRRCLFLPGPTKMVGRPALYR